MLFGGFLNLGFMNCLGNFWNGLLFLNFGGFFGSLNLFFCGFFIMLGELNFCLFCGFLGFIFGGFLVFIKGLGFFIILDGFIFFFIGCFICFIIFIFGFIWGLF